MEILATRTTAKFLEGGGEMGAMTRAFDWSSSPTGPVVTWPQSLKTLVGLLLHSNCPMILWWGDELIQFYNDAYRPSLGNDGKHPQALGQSGCDCWTENWHLISALIERVKDTGDSFFLEDQLIPVFRNGRLEDAYWTFNYIPVIGEQGGIDGVLSICNETTNKVVEQERFDSKISELSQFAYVVSNDLQEPVRKISAFAYMLKKALGESVDHRSEDIIDRIYKSAARMMNLINDVLQYSQLSTTHTEVSKVDLDTVITAALADSELLIEEKRCVIEVEALPTVQANPAQMRQLFGNLISNALKFSQPSANARIAISSRVLLAEEIRNYRNLSPARSYIDVIVSDNGIGFDQSMADKIFEVFERLNPADYKGTGIGLAICKKVVKNHQGAIAVESKEGAGTTFHVIIPE